jgi:hypothetical protein
MDVPNIENLISYLDPNGLGVIVTWDKIDIPNIVYEIRCGPTWNNGKYITRVSDNKFICVEDGTYWVVAYDTINYSYSPIPTNAVTVNFNFKKNSFVNYDESDTYWSGTREFGLAVSGADLILGGIGLFDDIPDLDAVPDIDTYGGVPSSRIYTIPIEHIANFDFAKNCAIAANFTLASDPNITSAKIQFSVQQNNLIWSDWKDFVQGQYIGKAFNFRLILMSSNPNVCCIVNKFNFYIVVDKLNYVTSQNSEPIEPEIPIQAKNVTSRVGGKDITDIFENDGVTAKAATSATSAFSAANTDTVDNKYANDTASNIPLYNENKVISGSATGDTRFQISGSVGGMPLENMFLDADKVLQIIGRNIPTGKALYIKRACYWFLDANTRLKFTVSTGNVWTSVNSRGDEILNFKIIDGDGTLKALLVYAHKNGSPSNIVSNDGWWLDLAIE